MNLKQLLTEWRWADFPRASWRCAVSGRSYNARIVDKFQQKLPSIVARRSTAVPIAAKMCDGARMRPEGVLFDPRV